MGVKKNFTLFFHSEALFLTDHNEKDIIMSIGCLDEGVNKISDLVSPALQIKKIYKEKGGQEIC